MATMFAETSLSHMGLSPVGLWQIGSNWRHMCGQPSAGVLVRTAAVLRVLQIEFCWSLHSACFLLTVFCLI